MAIHTFIVEVEVDRDSGLFASRDEIGERIEEALMEVESVDLSGLGANSDSEYSVQSFSVDVVDTTKKAGRDKLMEYDAQVIADLPGDATLRESNKALRAQLKELNRVLTDVKDRNIKLQTAMEEKQATERTRLWYADSTARRNDYKTFMPDGKYDRVFFQWGERDDECFAFEFQEDGTIEIRNQGWSQLTIVPNSSNVVYIKAVQR